MTNVSNALWYWLIDYYALATCVLAAASLAMVAIKQPARRLAVAWPALAGLVMLIVCTVVPGWPRTSVLAARRAAQPAEQYFAESDLVATVARAANLSHESTDLIAAPVDVPARAPSADRTETRRLPARSPIEVSRRPLAAPAERTAASALLTLSSPAMIVAFFLAGTVVMLVWLGLGFRQVAVLRRAATRAPGPVAALLPRVVEAGRAAPEVLISSWLPQPFAIGVLRPTIILPEQFIEDQAETRLEAALAHEWAHIRNGDLWLVALLRLLLPLMYAHPGYWWLRRRIRDDQEALADAAAAGAGVQGRVRYAEVLLSWSRCFAGRPPLAAAGSVALFERSSQIKWRIVMLLDRNLRVETTCPARWRLAVRGVTALAVLGVSLFTLRPAVNGAAGAAGPKPRQQAAPAQAPAPGQPGNSARVVDPDGKPFAGAKVYQTRIRRGLNTPAGTAKLLAVTGPDGSFSDPRPAVLPKEPDGEIVALAAGYGPALADPSSKQRQPVFTLVKDDVPLRGRVVDIQGRPVPGATIQVVGLLWHKSGKLDEWLEKLKLSKSAYSVQYEMLSWWSSDDIPSLFPAVQADKDGRFTIHGMGRDRIASLLVSGPAIETRFEYAVTRAMPTLKVGEFERQNRTAQIVYYGATFDLVAGPCLEAVGTITDKDSGKPIAGVTVQTAAFFGNPLRTLKTATDNQGHFRLSGIPPRTSFGDDQALLAGFNDAPPYLPALQRLPGEAQTGPVTVDFQLKRGVVVRGRVIEKASGQGVRANLTYYILPDNPSLKAYPRYGTPRVGGPYVTEEDGTFQLTVMPGPGVIGARVGNEHYRLGVGVETIPGIKHVDRDKQMLDARPYYLVPTNYHTILGINPQQSDEAITCEIALDRGRTVKGTVVDSDGKPLAGTRIEGLQDRFRIWSYQPLPSADFLVEGIGAKAERDLLVFHAEKKLAGAYTIKADEAGPITVKLEPCGTVTGRLLDTGGLPMADAEMTCNMRYDDKSHSHGSLPQPIKTDKDGRFSAAGLISERKYSFTVWKGQAVYDVVGARDIVVPRGQTKDLGDVTVSPSN